MAERQFTEEELRDEHHRLFGLRVKRMILDALNEGHFNLDVADLLDLAVKCKIASRVKYDPDEHGLIDAEEGDLIYWFK